MKQQQQRQLNLLLVPNRNRPRPRPPLLQQQKVQTSTCGKGLRVRLVHLSKARPTTKKSPRLSYRAKRPRWPRAGTLLPAARKRGRRRRLRASRRLVLLRVGHPRRTTLLSPKRKKKLVTSRQSGGRPGQIVVAAKSRESAPVTHASTDRKVLIHGITARSSIRVVCHRLYPVRGRTLSNARPASMDRTNLLLSSSSKPTR